jgi:hypothetical protein
MSDEREPDAIEEDPGAPGLDDEGRCLRVYELETERLTALAAVLTATNDAEWKTKGVAGTRAAVLRQIKQIVTRHTR